MNTGHVYAIRPEHTLNEDDESQQTLDQQAAGGEEE